MRVFVGVLLDKEAGRGVEKVINKVRRGHWPVRWVDKEKWHVTMAFVGQGSKSKVEQVVGAVRKGAKEIKPFEVGFKGLGAFPDLFLPRVVWMGLKGDLKSMFGLVKGVREELERVSIEFDKKPFRSHVTVGRVERLAKRKQRLELGKYLQKKRQLDVPQQWRVDRVVVYESKMGSVGFEYRIIEEIRL